MKISVGCQHGQLVTNTKLSEKCIDGSGLHASAPAFNSQFCRFDMIFPIRDNQWKRTESLDDLLMCLGFRKALEQFLENDTGTHDSTRGERASEFRQLRNVLRAVATQSQ